LLLGDFKATDFGEEEWTGEGTCLGEVLIGHLLVMVVAMADGRLQGVGEAEPGQGLPEEEEPEPEPGVCHQGGTEVPRNEEYLLVQAVALPLVVAHPLRAPVVAVLGVSCFNLFCFALFVS